MQEVKRFDNKAHINQRCNNAGLPSILPALVFPSLPFLLKITKAIEVSQSASDSKVNPSYCLALYFPNEHVLDLYFINLSHRGQD